MAIIGRFVMKCCKISQKLLLRLNFGWIIYTHQRFKCPDKISYLTSCFTFIFVEVT